MSPVTPMTDYASLTLTSAAAKIRDRGAASLRSMADSKIEKWRRWVEDDELIQSDILSMNLHRATFREVMKIAQEAELPESYFWGYMRETYAATQAVAIRRQAEVRSRVISLGTLLSEIEADAHRLTRKFWCGMWESDEHEQLVANRQFDDHMAGEAGGDHLNPSIPATDLETLTQKAESVKKYVDEHLAHADARRDPPSATFDDIDGALDTIGELFTKYVGFLTASTWTMLEPAIQHNWKAIFMRPWLPDPRERRGSA